MEASDLKRTVTIARSLTYNVREFERWVQTTLLDWRLMLKVFLVVLLSEMGDKTQTTTLLLAGAKPLYVLWVALGSAVALVITSLLEVTIGSNMVAKFVKPELIKIFSAVAFILLGLLLISGVIGNISLPG